MVAVIEKSEIYDGRQVFVEHEDQIQPEIELIDTLVQSNRSAGDKIL